MYYIKRAIIRFIYKHILKKNPLSMPMVRYWKTKEAAPAKITTNEDGALVMDIQGEDYPFPGFPRSHVLFGNFKGTGHGPLSVLKHTIKNRIFNESWEIIEKGGNPTEHIMKVLPEIFAITKEMEYEMIPPEKMFKSVREIWRALTVLEKRHKSQTIRDFKKTLCFILSEDDAYRMRVQWLVHAFTWFGKPLESLDLALQELENAEVVQDMKERQRLLRRVLMSFLKGKEKLFNEFWKEMRWQKIKLSEGDKYHFRAKYFKVDWDKFEY